MSSHRQPERDLAIGLVDLAGRDVARTSGDNPLDLTHCVIDREAARRLGIRVDTTRTTSLGCNVMHLPTRLAGP